MSEVIDVPYYADGRVQYVSVVCPAATPQAVNGGWLAQGVKVVFSRRSSLLKWRVGVVNMTAGSTGSVTAYAYCSKG